MPDAADPALDAVEALRAEGIGATPCGDEFPGYDSRGAGRPYPRPRLDGLVRGQHHLHALLLSAAAITGVMLRHSDFDVPAWMAAWERVGGRVEWHADREE